MSVYPWSAVVGQPALKQALLLCAIDPAIGGVLVQGPRGVAKTTLARALSELVAGAFVELPLGATEERITGTLDLDAALRERRVEFAPGLLSRAHEGVLYVDEVNLLADGLVDLLLDAAATGRNVVERDGVSHTHAARFVLVGTMNPEEGELRPQLIDRFGLCVHAEAEIAPAERAEIVRRRLEFDRAAVAFVARFAAEQRALIERCAQARARVATIPLDGPALERVTERCYAAGVEGVRADLAMLRAARAHAAWHGRSEIRAEDVDAVAEFALAHRAGRPFAGGAAGGGGQTGSGASAAGGAGPASAARSGAEGEVHGAGAAASSSGAARSPGRWSGSGARGPSGWSRAGARGPDENGAGVRGTNWSGSGARGSRGWSSSGARGSGGSRGAGARGSRGSSGAGAEQIGAEAHGAGPVSDPIANAAISGAVGSASHPHGALVLVPVRASVRPQLPPTILPRHATRHQRAHARRRGDAPLDTRSGTSSPGRSPHGPIDWCATLLRTPQPGAADLVRRARRGAPLQLWILVLDCSSSMLRHGALAAAKGTAHAFGARASRAGAHVALISFRGAGANTEVTSRAGRAVLERGIDALSGGGGTPLRAAMLEALRLCRLRAWRSPAIAKRLVLFTDGRIQEDVGDLASATAELEPLVIDCERGRLRLSRALQVAAALGGSYHHVDSFC